MSDSEICDNNSGSDTLSNSSRANSAQSSKPSCVLSTESETAKLAKSICASNSAKSNSSAKSKLNNSVKSVRFAANVKSRTASQKSGM